MRELFTLDKAPADLFTRLEKEGFRENSGAWKRKDHIKESQIVLEYSFSSLSMEVEAYDEEGEIFSPFSYSPVPLAFTLSLRERAEKEGERLKRILTGKGCSSLEKLLSIMEKEHQLLPSNPFSDIEAMAFRTGNGKWAALVMEVRAAALGLRKEGNIRIVNLKLSPETIARETDGAFVFPAYHMNKKHWVSVLLDEGLDGKRLSSLVSESVALVGGKK